MENSEKSDQEKSNEDLGKKTVGEIIKMLRPAALWSTLCALVALVTLSFAFGRFAEAILSRMSQGTNTNTEMKRENTSTESDTSLTKAGLGVVYLVGSGTVREYLNKTAPNLIFRDQAKNTAVSLDIHVLEGGTGTGSQLLSDVGTQLDILAMASDTLSQVKLDLFRKRESFFEVFLGIDTLKVIIVASNDDQLIKTFPGLWHDSNSLNERKTIRISELAPLVWRQRPWKTEGYDLFVTEYPSATRKLYAKKLVEGTRLGSETDQQWPDSSIALKPGYTSWRHGQEDFLENRRPLIALSSHVLNFRINDKLRVAQDKQTKAYRILRVVDDQKGREVKRGLFLYGGITRKETAPGIGYELRPATARFLKLLFEELKKAPREYRTICDSCIVDQEDYFGVKNDSSGAWVVKQSSLEIYRVRSKKCGVSALESCE